MLGLPVDVALKECSCSLKALSYVIEHCYSLDMLFIACVRAWASNIFLILDDCLMYYGLFKGMTVVLV